MKSCFSTLGCPDWDVDQIIRCCAENEFEGVELRGLEGEMELPRSPLLAPGKREAFAARFADVGTKIAALGTSCCFAQVDRAKRRQQIDSCKFWIELAGDLGCPVVRVFGGRLPEGCELRDAAGYVAESLMELADMAAEHQTALALETHDEFITGEIVARVLEQAEHPAVGALWDVNHPYRAGEPIADTAGALGKRIIHVHMKDSKLGEEGKLEHCLLGEGDLPLREILQELSKLGYQGFLSLEWEKKWHPEIAEPEVAFPHYARKLRELLAEL